MMVNSVVTISFVTMVTSVACLCNHGEQCSYYTWADPGIKNGVGSNSVYAKNVGEFLI